ncbi:MAG: YggS family pyridoxal phosphate-dependent enzyme [Alphaproteobacteria bacterium]
MLDEIGQNLKTIKAAIKTASQPGGHPPANLIAVSKGHGVDKICTALEAGHRLFGENRVQEASVKWPQLREQFPGLELHLIGPLQTNKVKLAVSLFDAIETLDRPKLARALSVEIEKSGKTPKLFIQVNTGEEPQKAGVLPSGLVSFFEECQGLGLNVSGLMCIPPVDEEPAMHFALLKKLGGGLGLKEFSMGMSGDFEVASSLGATHVRVGTAIFGPRR